MTKHMIYLYDPFGGGSSFEVPGMIIVRGATVRPVAAIEPFLVIIGEPGELRVTQPALDLLGVDGVVVAFIEHIAGKWWSNDPDDRIECNKALLSGKTIYNIDQKKGVYLITYQGDNSTLITRDEY